MLEKVEPPPQDMHVVLSSETPSLPAHATQVGLNSSVRPSESRKPGEHSHPNPNEMKKRLNK